jgi:hypothetical protein
MPNELADALRRIENLTAACTERLSNAQARWKTTSAPRDVDPERLRTLAESPGAPDELRAVAKAVREGRTTWRQAVAGDADHLPEVRAFHQAQRERLVQQPPAPRTRADDETDQPMAVHDTW